MPESKAARIQSLSTAIPWALYFSLPYAGLPLGAVIAAFIAALYPAVSSAIRGASIKLVDLVTLIFFAIGVIASLASASAAAMFSQFNFVLVWVLFTAMASISLLVGKPFTLQFARESTPPEIWNLPVFLHANVVITLAWTAAFAINLVVALIALRLGTTGAIVAGVSQFIPMAGAVVFMNRYRASLQQQRAAAAPAPAA
jgi:hypothetical protein